MSIPRTRTTNNMTLSPGMPWTARQMPAGNLIASGTDGSGMYGGTFKEVSDYVTPGFRSVVKKGGIVNSPCEIKYSEVRLNGDDFASSNNPSGGSWIATEWKHDALSVKLGGIVPSGNNGFTDLNSIAAYNVVGVTSRDTLIGRAAVSALSKVEPPEMQSIVTLAELDKTIALIGSTAINLAAALKAIKSGKPDEAIRRVFGRPSARRQPHPIKYTRWSEGGEPRIGRSGKPSVVYGHKPRRTDDSSIAISDVQSKWLEYRYGWGPTVMDIVSALKALNKVRENRRFMVRGSSSSDGTSSFTVQQSSSDGGRLTKRHDVSHSRSCRAYVLYEVDPGLALRFQDFGLLDFPSTAWELLPYSFVIDWFISVGDWIQALTPKIGVNILASGYSFKDIKEVTRTVTAWTPDSTGPGGWSSPRINIGSTDSAKTATYSRVTNLTVPLLPPPDVQLNIKRAVDGIALLSGLRSRTTRI